MGLTKPIEQNLFSYQGTFMYLKDIIRDIIRGGKQMKKTYITDSDLPTTEKPAQEDGILFLSFISDS